MAASRKIHPCTDPYVLAETIAHLCEDPHPEKEGWRARCPNHQGTSDTSLSLTPGEDRVLLNCFGGCSPQAVVGALNLTMADLFIKTGQKTSGLGQIVQIYDYYDAAGTLVHQTVRYAPKAFRQRRPDPANPGRYLWDLKTIQPVLYHLPDVLMAIQTEEPVYLTEGEKDADTLVSLGFVATCNPMGAGKWDPTYSESLRGASVVILAHFDTPGAKHADMVALSLHGIAQTIRLVHAFHTDTPGSDFTDWLEAGGTKEEFEAIVNTAPVYGLPDAPVAPLGWSINGQSPPGRPAEQAPAQLYSTEWRKDLFYKSKKSDELTQNVFNITKILENHPYWQEPDQALWWDAVRGTPMCGTAEITDKLMMQIATWFGGVERLPITSPALLEKCVIARCKGTPRDLLQIWLNGLAPWDGTPRLLSWLHTIAGVPRTPYNDEVSRVLVVSMVARALVPGCHYRYVVVLEGLQEFGKSTLVRNLASPEWYLELLIGFETKEAHMMLQGAWVAELAELDSMSRTDETRLKAFITMREDSYIPKYSNFRQRTERRCIFIGTTNEDQWMKDQTGGTRYLPLHLPDPIDHAHFLAMRLQLFAEALTYYYAHPDDFWQFSPDAMGIAQDERERRRVAQVYEGPLEEWLEDLRWRQTYHDPDGRLLTFTKDETSWQEIALCYLKIEPERWKDKGLQIQIIASLKALGWYNTTARKGGRVVKVWRKTPTVPF